MEGDRERWDAKYRGRWGRELKPHDPFVARALETLGPGADRPALDLAAGTGRHALELARRGWRTSAWDVSPVALERLAEFAAASGVTVGTGAFDLLEPRAAFPETKFELVVVVDFLDRPLWTRLHELVRPAGRLILRTFTQDWTGEKPPRRFRLEPGELRAGIEGFESIEHEESGGRAGLIARRV